MWQIVEIMHQTETLNTINNHLRPQRHCYQGHWRLFLTSKTILTFIVWICRIWLHRAWVSSIHVISSQIHADCICSKMTSLKILPAKLLYVYKRSPCWSHSPVWSLVQRSCTEFRLNFLACAHHKGKSLCGKVCDFRSWRIPGDKLKRNQESFFWICLPCAYIHSPAEWVTFPSGYN